MNETKAKRPTTVGGRALLRRRYSSDGPSTENQLDSLSSQLSSLSTKSSIPRYRIPLRTSRSSLGIHHRNHPLNSSGSSINSSPNSMGRSAGSHPNLSKSSAGSGGASNAQNSRGSATGGTTPTSSSSMTSSYIRQEPSDNGLCLIEKPGSLTRCVVHSQTKTEKTYEDMKKPKSKVEIVIDEITQVRYHHRPSLSASSTPRPIPRRPRPVVTSHCCLPSYISPQQARPIYPFVNRASRSLNGHGTLPSRFPPRTPP